MSEKIILMDMGTRKDGVRWLKGLLERCVGEIANNGSNRVVVDVLALLYTVAKHFEDPIQGK